MFKQSSNEVQTTVIQSANTAPNTQSGNTAVNTQLNSAVNTQPNSAVNTQPNSAGNTQLTNADNSQAGLNTASQEPSENSPSVTNHATAGSAYSTGYPK